LYYRALKVESNGKHGEEGVAFSLQRQNAENLKQIFPEKEYRGLSPNFHIHVSVSDLYIPTMGLPFRSWEYINHSQKIVEIGAEDAQFPEKEYINGIAVAVRWINCYRTTDFKRL
jgi:hypothetical protein